MEIVIRRAVADDAPVIRDLHEAAILAQAPRCYDASQVAAWAAPRPIENLVRGIAERTYLVAVDGAQIVGFGAIATERGELFALYVAPEQMDRGIGRQLLRALEDAAQAGGSSRVHCHASLNAQRFYECCGYLVTESTCHEFRDGTRMPCVAVEKILGDEP